MQPQGWWYNFSTLFTTIISALQARRVDEQTAAR